jgi:hypothetical protein
MDLLDRVMASPSTPATESPDSPTPKEKSSLHSHMPSLGMAQLVGITYFSACGGPFGFEEAYVPLITMTCTSSEGLTERVPGVPGVTLLQHQRRRWDSMPTSHRGSTAYMVHTAGAHDR